MQRIIEFCHLCLGAVDRQGVAGEVVGADGEEIRFERQGIGRQGGTGVSIIMPRGGSFSGMRSPRRRRRRATRS